MAGGSGTRLWPLSRAQHPKQFLVLHGNRSLFQQAASRLAALAGEGFAIAPPCVVGNEEHRFLVLDQLRELGSPCTDRAARAGRAQHRAGDDARRPARRARTAPTRSSW